MSRDVKKMRAIHISRKRTSVAKELTSTKALRVWHVQGMAKKPVWLEWK